MMIRGTAITAVLVAGCGFSAQTGPASDATTVTGDAAVDAPAGCFGILVTVCPSTLPTMPKVLTGTIDTTQYPDCEPTNTALDACVIAGTTITVPATVTGVGAKPLVLFATESIMIDGTLDVASHRGLPRGAGSGTGACDAGTNPTGLGGGQGGSYGGTGGAGGDSDNASNRGLAGIAVTMWTGLRGGCDGARGGNNLPMGGTEHGAGGFGGGAVALLAPAIAIAGSINASGAAGLRSDDTPSPAGGAGGGGSGGTIVLDTGELVITGRVFSQGGGGAGGGACSTDGSANAHGKDPTSTGPGIGGIGNVDGGCVGGNGGVGSTGGAGNGGSDGVSGGAGGGGGGSAGVIKTSDPSPPENVSPPFS
jgi:hypothetical protein